MQTFITFPFTKTSQISSVIGSSLNMITNVALDRSARRSKDSDDVANKCVKEREEKLYQISKIGIKTEIFRENKGRC
jgi:hypothetical protein